MSAYLAISMVLNVHLQFAVYFRHFFPYLERNRIVVHTEKFSMLAQVDQLDRLFHRSVGHIPLYHRTTRRSDQTTHRKKQGKKKPRAPGNHEKEKFCSFQSFQKCFEKKRNKTKFARFSTI